MKTSTPAPVANESFAALFEESLSRKEMRVGEVITAEVIRVDDNFVVVNAGLKSESYIQLDEFRNDRGEVEVQPGDFISVAIESLEDGHGDSREGRACDGTRGNEGDLHIQTLQGTALIYCRRKRLSRPNLPV